MIRNPFRRSPQACDPQVAQRVLIASEGRRFSADVIETAVRMLRDGGGQARVLTIARLWGTSFGLPNPGLRPSKSEMAEQQDNIHWAIGELEKAGVDADGHIITTRNPGKSILNEARRQNCRAIIMGTDPKRRWLIRSLMWSQEPYRVLARAHIPVHLVGPSGPI